MQVSKGWSIFGCRIALLFATACGSVSSNDGADSNTAPVGDFALSVDPSSLTIPIASSAKLTVTVLRNNAPGDIALTATGLSANLTADFSPAVIPSDAQTSEVTMTVKGGTAAGMSTFKITGTLGDKTHSVDVSVTTTTITVSGVVRGGRAGIKVGIIGKGSQTSGAGGLFTFADVTPPYDLYTVADFVCGNNTTPTAYYFDDLTIPAPVVTAATPCNLSLGFLCAINNTCPKSSVSGTKSGAGNNTDDAIFVWSEGSFSGGVLNSNGTFSGTAGWINGSTSSGYLHSLQLTRKANGAPNTFLGYARTPSTLTNAQAATINLNFNVVNSVATVTGTVNPPTGYPMPSVQLVQEFGNTQRSLWSATTSAIDASFPILSLAGGTNLYAAASLDGGTSYFVQPLTATTTVNVTMPPAAVIAEPASGATGVTTATTFAFNAPSGVLSEAVLTSNNAAIFRIFTTNAQFTIPVIPDLALPSGKSFSWSVYGYGPYSSVNEAAGPNEVEMVSTADFAGPAHFSTLTGSRSFTTQ